jgi:hypothetical protein
MQLYPAFSNDIMYFIYINFFRYVYKKNENTVKIVLIVNNNN